MASRTGASSLLQFCLRYVKCHFEQAEATGVLRQLHTSLCAQVFTLRSDAPLQDAFSHGRSDVVKHLLMSSDSAEEAVSSVSYVNSLDTSGRTPLEVALRASGEQCQRPCILRIEMASLLISRGASVDAMVGGSDEPLLHMTCTRTLQDDGGKAKFQVHSLPPSHITGESALDAALFHSTPGVVQLLLEHGATSTMATSIGGSLLHAAADEGRADVIEMALASLA
ncbi:MAG: hypothetical protein SGPRY_012937 [Prymnesium sp.]